LWPAILRAKKQTTKGDRLLYYGLTNSGASRSTFEINNRSTARITLGIMSQARDLM